MIVPLLILAVFLVFAALMYTRAMPALLAVPAMAVIMALVAGVPGGLVGSDVIVKGASALAGVYVTVILGAMLGRVTLDTGIARSIVNFAAEFGGEQPMVLALLLCAVVAVLFVSLSGLGAIIMVGSIVLPIMMTTGVPRKIASTMFLMAFALGFIFNLVNWKFYIQTFGVSQQQMYGYALVLAAIDLVALLLYTFVSFSRSRAYATWAVKAEQPQTARVPWFALVTPVLPIVLFYALHFDPTLSFIIAAVYGAVTTRPARAVQTLVAAAIKGVEDVAPAVVLFMGIGMLLTASKEPQFGVAMHALATSQALHNPFIYVIIFGVLSPLALYRGPLNPFGVGIAIFIVLLNAHALPAVILVAAIMAVVQVQNVCDPTNTANVWVANYTGVHIEEITRRTLPYQTAVAVAGCIAVAVASNALFGMRPFTAFIPAAAAAELPPPGMFAPQAAVGRIAVGTDGSADASLASAAIVRELNGSRVKAFALQSDPNASDCTGKPYAAYAEVLSTRFTLIEGTDIDIGIRLFDCGGWVVNEWHDHAVFARPASADIEQLAREGAARMRGWGAANGERWSHLLAQGL
ncbi:MAG TPA: hypothetical protein VIO32_03370, partial [Candidatus Baltobacteraceae bacterium]